MPLFFKIISIFYYIFIVFWKNKGNKFFNLFPQFILLHFYNYYLYEIDFTTSSFSSIFASLNNFVTCSLNSSAKTALLTRSFVFLNIDVLPYAEHRFPCRGRHGLILNAIHRHHPDIRSADCRLPVYS